MNEDEDEVVDQLCHTGRAANTSLVTYYFHHNLLCVKLKGKKGKNEASCFPNSKLNYNPEELLSSLSRLVDIIGSFDLGQGHAKTFAARTSNPPP
jgi:hypothetical protein